MIFPSADKLENWGNRYALATLAAKRAKQIKSGAPPLINTDSVNPLTIALEEIAAGKISCRVPDYDALPQTTIEPEIEQLLAIPEELEEEAEALTAETPSSTETEAVSLEEELEEEELEEEEEIEEEHEIWGEDIEEEAEEEILPPLVDEEEVVPEADVDLDIGVPEDVLEVEPDTSPKPRGRRRTQSKQDVEDIEEIESDLDVPEVDYEEPDEDEDLL